MPSSAEKDLLILVDDSDQIIGYESKTICHLGKGLLHRAFSIFIFNSHNELLLQQRSAEKMLWPLYWSNSVCSHPRKDETILNAAHRRLREEASLVADLQFVYKFSYHAPYLDIGSENELCSVFLGRSEHDPGCDPCEIADFRWVSFEDLSDQIAKNPDIYTPWFKLEIQELSKNYFQMIKSV
jgi:isopentenyl-diphosphate delta-isomerase